MNLKRRLQIFKDLELMLGAERYIWYNDQMLSDQDIELVKDCYGIWYIDLLELLSVSPHTPAFGRARQLLQLILRIDVYAWMSTLDAMCEVLMRSVNENRSFRAEYMSCAASVSCVEPLRILMGLIKPIRIDWELYKNPDAFSRLRELFVVINRLPLRDVEDLETTAYSKWKTIEDQPPVTDIGGPEADLISQWFPKTVWPFEEFFPQHGSGRVAETSDTLRAKKYRLMQSDAKLRCLYKQLGMDPDAWEGELVTWWRGLHREQSSMPADELAFVPKNWKTRRSITFAPVARMYAQQGVRHWIYTTVDRPGHPLGRFWQPYSCERNRLLALEGSRDGRYSTIDLSSASDSVTEELVKTFYRKSGLFMPLFLTRSSFVHYREKDMQTGEEHDVERRYRMFAPMGSATCFAVLSTTCASIAVGTVQQNPNSDQTVSVVGDDIIVATENVDAVVARLEQLGFQVNHTKSFTNALTWDKPFSKQHFFRESCGIEALDGFDVTPFRIPRKFLGLPKRRNSDPEVVAAVMCMCNSVGRHGLLRSYLIESLRRHNIPVLFDEDGTKGIKSPNPTNHHLRMWYNYEFQQYEVQCWALSHTHGCAAERYCNGEAALFEWLRTSAQTPSRLKPSRRHRLQGARIRQLSPTSVIRADIHEDKFKMYADLGFVSCTENGIPL